MTGSFLFQAVIYLTAAVVCVPVAKKLGLSSVLGYLFAGILIGPYLFGFIGEEGDDILHFAEFGVVMMLFLIGLEINPKTFWHMRKSILGMGGLQVGVTMIVIFTISILIGLTWPVSLTIAMALALSSTAIVLQTLKEKGLMETVYGRSSFSVLLFQDIAVIPMLAILPLFGSQFIDVAAEHNGSLLDQLPIGFQTLAVLLSVGLVALSGKYVIVPVLRLVATTGLRELFTASALLIVISISFLMEQVGLSPALGAFLGGVILANSEYKHELESNLDPFKGLLLGLFFIAVGASINFKIIGDAPVLVGGLVLGTILIKTLVLLGVGKLFKLNTDQNLLFSIGLSQIGEFAFVLLSFSSQLHIIEQPQLDLLLVITALSMTISPIIGMINERLILPRIGTVEKVNKAADSIESKQKVILVGFGHFGSTIGRFLRANGVNTVILDHDSNRVDLLRRIGFEVYYGDATREDLLESAGAGEAQILISAIDDPDANMKLVKLAQKHFTNLKLVIRAKSRVDAYQLLNLGIENVYRESLDTSIKLASDVLGMMGHRKHTISKQANKFIKHDEASMRRLSKTIMNSDDYISKVREEIAQQETLLRSDLMSKSMIDADQHWDADQVRDEQK